MKEDKASWVSFFQWLCGRGLDGVKLIVGDIYSTFDSFFSSSVSLKNCPLTHFVSRLARKAESLSAPVFFTPLRSKGRVFKFCQIIYGFLIASFYDKPGRSARHTTGAFSFSGFGTLPENNESTVRIRE